MTVANHTQNGKKTLAACVMHVALLVCLFISPGFASNGYPQQKEVRTEQVVSVKINSQHTVSFKRSQASCYKNEFGLNSNELSHLLRAYDNYVKETLINTSVEVLSFSHTDLFFRRNNTPPASDEDSLISIRG